MKKMFPGRMKVAVTLICFLVPVALVEHFIFHESLNSFSLIAVFGLFCIMIFLLHHITQIKKLELQMNTILDHATPIIYIKNLDGQFININPAFEKMYGINRNQIIGKTCFDLLPGEQAELHAEHEKTVIRTYRSHTFEEPVQFNQLQFIFLKTIFPLFDSRKKLYGIGAILTDITDRKMIENELRQLNKSLESRIRERTVKLEEGERKWRTIFENIQDVFYQTDMKGRITQISPSVRSYSGLTCEGLIGRYVRMFYHNKADYCRFLREILKTGRVQDFEVRLKSESGTIVWTSVNAHFIMDASGKPCGFEGTLRDISNRKASEREIRKLSYVLEQSPVCVLIMDAESRIEYVNRYFSDYTGYLSSEVTGSTPEFLLSRSKKYVKNRTLLKKVMNKQIWSGDIRIWPKKGSGLWTHGSIAPLLDDSGRIVQIVAVFFDISHRKRIEEELVQERSMMKNLMSNIPDAIYFKDRKSRFTRINHSLARFLGLNSPEEAIGKTDLDFFDDRHGQEAYKDEREIIKSGKPMICKVEQDILPSGITRWVSSTKMPVRNKNNKITGLVGISRDISDVKRFEDELATQNIELRKAKIKAESATRAKSEFLANMSHEIRTPMNAILGFSEILASRIEDPTLISYIQSINASGKTLLQLINDILDLSKIEAGKLELSYSSLNIKHVFKEMEQIFSFKIKEKGVEFILDISPELPEALVLDEVRLRQILLNLIGNAVKFTPAGSIKVSAYPRDVDYDSSRLTLCFEVKDTGMGIASDQQILIFEAFQQQSGQDHARFGGTGLGLAITKRLVEMMNGSIELKSKKDEGSTFQIILKDVAISAIHDLRDHHFEESAELTFCGGSLLVVDDIASNRTLVKSFLETTNLQVFEAVNGKEAIDQARILCPDCILLDIKMPVMDGYQAIKILKTGEKTKTIPVVMLTASAMKSDERKIRDIGADGYLRKPISRQELLKELSRHLEHSRLQDSSGIQTQNIEIFRSDEPFDCGSWEKAIALIEVEQMPVWSEVKNSVVISEIESFAQAVYNIGESMDTAPLRRWGKQLMNKVIRFEMESIPEMIQRFPDVINQMKSCLESEGVCHESIQS